MHFPFSKFSLRYDYEDELSEILSYILHNYNKHNIMTNGVFTKQQWESEWRTC